MEFKLQELEASVLRRPAMYFGSIDVRGIKELIFSPLWDFAEIKDELQIDLYINIKQEGIHIKIIDNCKVLFEIFKQLEQKFLATLVLTRYCKIYYDTNKVFEFNQLNQLSAFLDQFQEINAIEYLIEDSFFQELIDREKLFFELKGKARIFSAINSNCKVILEDEGMARIDQIFYPSGLNDFLREVDYDRVIVGPCQIFNINYENNIGKFKLCLRVCHTGPQIIYSFVNGRRTIDGGMHEIALKNSLSKFEIMVSDYTLKNNKSMVSYTRFESYTAVLSVFIDKCEWEGSVREKLLNKDVYELIVEGFDKNIDCWKDQVIYK